jgi:glycosyltransferase involved in cell wall biosynthesis
VVHAHDLWANLMAVPAARLAGAPLVLSSQRDLAHLWWYTPFRTRIIRRVHRWSSFIIANSTAVRNLLVDDFRIPEERVCVIRNGVNLDRFLAKSGDRQKLLPGVDPQAPLVITVGNMHSRVKGHYELVEAVRSIRDPFPNAKFLIVGDGEERPRIERAAQQAGVGDMFVFLGQRADIPDLLSCCDLFVLPSLAEGLPNAILEAMASGLPVVATRVGGIPEIIEDGRTGLMVPPKDPKALAEAIMRVLRDAEFATMLADSGQERVHSEFSFHRAVESLNHLYTTSA